jgi:hypothetical protein
MQLVSDPFGGSAPSCVFEAMNTDVLVLIMSAASSLEDLSALIHASPILYQHFLSAKASILLRVGACGLGPGIRDAVILAYTVMEPFVNSDEAYYDRVEDTVERYRERLLSRRALWAAGISPETAACIARLNRTIQYFVGLYVHVRFVFFERNLSPPLCNWALCTAERHRIAQAFVRYQIIVNMYCVTKVPPHDKEFFFTRIFGLYESWEMEQVSQADKFAHTLCAALLRLEKMSDGSRFTPEVEQAMRNRHEATSHLRRWGGPTKEVYSPRGWYFARFHPDLPAFRKKLLEATAADPELMREILDWPGLSDGQFGGTSHAFLCASHLYRTWPKTPRPPPPSLPCNAISKSPAETPWGWTHALRGHEESRWGLDLLSPPPHGTPGARWSDTKRRFSLWRWVGFVFWDRDRVEAMLKTELLAGNNAGWLAAPWG